MKPLSLTLQAFGPFASKESVDFTRLGTNPLFLINGATGAGKSSILDAICYALYNQTTGAERDPVQMRCDFAEPALLTEVSLVFELGDKQYRIRRAPTQERPKKSGEGTTSQVAEAQLWELDGSKEGKLLVSKSVNEANQAVRELIGLEVEQFRQVMVLPQGKFMDLLLADSKDREAIFSQLFQTGIYKRIEEALKAKASGIRQAKDDQRSQIRGILQTADVNTEEEISAEIEALSPQLKAALKLKKKSEKDKKASEDEQTQASQLVERFNNLAAKELQLTQNLEQEPTIKALQAKLDRANNAQKIQPIFVNKDTSETTLKSLQLELEESKTAINKTKQDDEAASKALEAAKKEALKIADLNKQQLTLERQSKQIQESQQAQQKLTEAEKDFTDCNLQLGEKKDSSEALCKERDANEAEIEKLLKRIESLGDKQLFQQDQASQLKKRLELETLRKQAVGQTEKEQESRQLFKEAETTFQACEKSTTEMEFRWHAGQAALLARELQDNAPCPVCGSQDHPEPANVNDDIELVDNKTVERARATVAEARRVMDGHKKTWDAIASDLTQTNKNCQKLEAQLAELADQPLERIEKAALQANTEVDSLKREQERCKTLQKRTREIKQEVSKLSEVIEASTKQVNQLNAQVVGNRATVEAMLRDVPEDLLRPDVLITQLEQLKEDIQQLIQVCDTAEQQRTEARSAFDKAKTHHEGLQKQCKSQLKKVNTDNDKWKAILASSLFEDDQAFKSALLEDEQQQAIKTEIENYRSGIDELKGAIKEMKSVVKDKVQPDLKVYEQALAKNTEAFTQADTAWRKLEERKNQLNSVQKKLDQAHKASEVLDAEYKVIGTLSEVANGQTGNKISLQRFVLSVLLDDVLIQASQRLGIMSKGRYQLVRKEDRAKGNKASGLELEVEDGYSGKMRAVATLSGGESFMAALSLALGLSDVVQSYAGGIKLDTLFIDEGFGSLDPESLDLAVRTLIDLQASGRMIGVISHVSELKEQMALRLDVVGGRSGSHISTIAAA